MNNFKCKLCDKQLSTLLSLSKHIRMNHKYNGGILNYYLEYENLIIPKCSFCENDAKLLKGISFRKTCGNIECKNKSHQIKLDEKTKTKISEKMVLLHKNGLHPGWSFINKDINRRSYPEKWFIKNVLEKYKLYDKYTIKEKLPFSKYFLDFAIMDLKIDIEIDGQQHIRNGETILHDKLRDEFMLSHGWAVYRIAWVELKNNSEETISKFLKDINNKNFYIKYNLVDITKYLNPKKQIHGSREKYFEYIKSIRYNDNVYKIQKIKNSDIDFSKFGWVKKVSEIVNIKHQKVNKWMKKYMLDFYNEKCFKRKNGKM